MLRADLHFRGSPHLTVSDVEPLWQALITAVRLGEKLAGGYDGADLRGVAARDDRCAQAAVRYQGEWAAAWPRISPDIEWQ